MEEGKKPIITSIDVVPRYVNHTLLCPECNSQMKATGTVLTSFPPQYPHKCTKCGYEIRYGIHEKYPYIETIYDEIKK